MATKKSANVPAAEPGSCVMQLELMIGQILFKVFTRIFCCIISQI